MRNVLEAIEGITLHSLDLLHKLLPCQQAGDVSDAVDDIYDQLEVNIQTTLVCVCTALCISMYVAILQAQ